MPARQPFDERHLQDVVLAQSGQIRPAKRFSGLEVLTRPLVALAAMVAIIAIALGVKDYVEQQNAISPADTGTPTVEHTKAITHRKKTASGKADRTRMSASEATGDQTGEAEREEQEKSLVGEPSGDAGTTRGIVMGNRTGPLTQTAEREAIDRDQGNPNQRDTMAKPGLPTCLPLPNGTRPGDVDAPYYFGWATEYCGQDLNRSSTPSKVPESKQSKK